MTATATPRVSKDEIVDRLSESAVYAVVQSLGVVLMGGSGADNWSARSPLREGDRNPSLSIRKHDGVWNDKGGNHDAGDLFDLVMRLRGCDFPEALAYVAPFVGIGTFASSPVAAQHAPSTSKTRGTVAATYDYPDETGQVLYQAVRFDPKGFAQRKPNGAGSYTWSLNGTRRVLYRLPELLAADPGRVVVVCEGEKDVDRLVDLKVIATTNPEGAGKWRDDYSMTLAGRKVVILPDNDDAGRKHAEQVARSLAGIAQSVRIVSLPGLPEKGDVSDWLDAGGTIGELKQLIDNTPTWTPTPEPIATAPALVITSLDDVDERPVEWLWHRWLARGKVHLLGGHAGDGKSTLTTWLAALMSRGGTLPDGTTAPIGRTLFLIAEDGIADTLKPRLAQHGADHRMIYVLEAVREPDGSDRAFSLSKHLPLLRQAITQYEIDTVTIDPLSAFMAGADRNGEEIRDILTPLGQLADQTGVAVLGLMHVGKPSGNGHRRAVQQLLGATAFVAVARIVWMIAPVVESDDPSRRALGIVKNNLAIKPPTFEWSRPEDQAIRWHGQSEQDIEHLLSAPAGKKQSPEREEILDLLRDAGEPMSPQAIADALEKNVATVRVLLRRMADQGSVEQPAYGQYAFRKRVHPVNSVDSSSASPSKEFTEFTEFTALPPVQPAILPIGVSNTRNTCLDCGTPIGGSIRCSGCAGALVAKGKST